jgi:hypothetical protein
MIPTVAKNHAPVENVHRTPSATSSTPTTSVLRDVVVAFSLRRERVE